MTDEELQKIDDYVHELILDIDTLDDNAKLLNLDDELAEDLDKVIKLLKRKTLEITHAENKKQLKKLVKLKNILEAEKN